MKKLTLIILILVAVFSLSSFRSSALDTCTGTSMCAGSYLLNCGVADGYCPTDYGDWNSCGLDAYGGECSPCDSDCTTPCTSGSGGTFLDLDCSPAVVDPNGQVKVKAKATNVQANDILRIYEAQSIPTTGDWQKKAWKTKNCGAGNCELTATNTTSNKGGVIFYYTATTDNLWLNEGKSVTKSCLTNPLCDININSTRTEGGGLQKFISGTATVTLNVDSASGVQRRELYFYKWNKNLKVFSPMTPPEQGCSISQCNFADCNKLVVFGNTYNWDTTKCENGDYSLTMTGVDNNNNSCTDSDQATIEGSVICVDQCSLFTSKILNTIIVKIKSWI